MKTIGIIGASGQVGTEVCLFLRTYGDVRPVAIVRHSVSAAMLRRLGIETRIGIVGNPQETTELLKDCDVVTDFAVPGGEAHEIKAHYGRNISAAMTYAPTHAAYIFISTINAFGMNSIFNRAKYYRIPHSVYAHTKRFGERIARQFAITHGRPTYVFRLGHVHGLLQRVSHETAELVRQPYRRFEYPDTPSYTIFCHSIAEALLGVAGGKQATGTFTLVSVPAWSWQEVLEYHAEPSRRIEVRLRPLRRTSHIGQLKAAASRWGGAVLRTYKDTVTANILQRFPTVEARLRARYYCNNAQQQIRHFDERDCYRAEGIHEGVLPGNRLSCISDSRVTMPQKAAEVRSMLSRMWEQL